MSPKLCAHASPIPIVDALKELKWSRPAWTQRMLIRFIEEAKKECFKYEGDGTFNHIVDEIFNKEIEKKEEEK